VRCRNSVHGNNTLCHVLTGDIVVVTLYSGLTVNSLADRYVRRALCLGTKKLYLPVHLIEQWTSLKTPGKDEGCEADEFKRV
jgi:hypothetical protein